MTTKSPILSSDKVGLIFSNLDFIRSINGGLLNRLKERIENWYPGQLIGEAFLELVRCNRGI